MSQITRCPSCGTSFKVVPDQLRISEGWVRCGQCKEVFDASAHLLAAPPAPLLPDVSLTDVKPPPAPVARAAEAPRAWGAPATRETARHTAAPVSPTASAAPAAPATVSLTPTPTPATPATPSLQPTQAPAAPPGQPVQAADSMAQPVPAPVQPMVQPAGLHGQGPVLDVPEPTVPAFLAASRFGAADGELELEPVSPFGWRSPSSSRPAAPVPEQARAPVPRDMRTPGREDALPWTPAASPGIQPAGYELPAADIPDSEWPLDDDLARAPHAVALEQSSPSVRRSEAPSPSPMTRPDVAAAPRGTPFPPLELPRSPSVLARAEAADGGLSMPAAVAPLPPIDFVQEEDTSAGAAQDADGVSPEAPTAPHGRQAAPGIAAANADIGAAESALGARGPADAEDADDSVEAEEAAQALGFVQQARRKAFWSRPAVRAALSVLVLCAVLALALQVAVHERDRIAAWDARARPWLAQLCAPLRCEVQPRRQIADVVIDSSSFNKARGDSYQLAVTMKNQAAIPLAMPAIELTLTDTQDQPVLRRVLLPTDMAAPAELPARGEWSASVSVIVTTGGARVAGYRLLAFYP